LNQESLVRSGVEKGALDNVARRDLAFAELASLQRFFPLPQSPRQAGAVRARENGEQVWTYVESNRIGDHKGKPHERAAFADRIAETVQDTLCREERYHDKVWRVLVEEYFSR
jgi:hypothetical protein